MKVKLGFKKIEITDASSFKKRLLGLMGKRNIKEGLLFRNCNSIHTYFMKENIDVVFLDNDYKILEIHKNVPKNKLIHIKRSIKNTHTLELPKNMSKHLRINNTLIFEN